MNKSFSYIILLLSVWMFTSCLNKTKQENIITVTIEPQRYFAEQLVDSFFKVVTMVPSGKSPEDYDPTPQQMTNLAKSKAYFCIGQIGFEKIWLDKLKKNNPRILFFDNGKGIQSISSESHNQTSDDHGHSAMDPHTWSSPKEALIIVQNMYEALIKMDPDHSLSYQLNLEKLIEKINETNQIVEEYLNHSSQKSFIIYHPALTYFACDYGLIQYPIELEGKEPTPEQLKNLIDTAKKEAIKVIFIQQEFDQKNAEIIAKETGCKLVVINPLAYDWSEEIIKIAQALSDE